MEEVLQRRRGLYYYGKYKHKELFLKKFSSTMGIKERDVVMVLWAVWQWRQSNQLVIQAVFKPLIARLQVPNSPVKMTQQLAIITPAA